MEHGHDCEAEGQAAQCKARHSGAGHSGGACRLVLVVDVENALTQHALKSMCTIRAVKSLSLSLSLSPLLPQGASVLIVGRIRAIDTPPGASTLPVGGGAKYEGSALKLYSPEEEVVEPPPGTLLSV